MCCHRFPILNFSQFDNKISNFHQFYLNIIRKKTGWTYANATGKATVTINDLTPITKYWFRVAALMAEGTAAYCEPISIVIG